MNVLDPTFTQVPQFPAFQTVNFNGCLGLRTLVGEQLYSGSVESESGLAGLEDQLRQIIKEEGK